MVTSGARGGGGGPGPTNKVINYIILTPRVSNTNWFLAQWSEARAFPALVVGSSPPAGIAFSESRTREYWLEGHHLTAGDRKSVV